MTRLQKLLLLVIGLELAATAWLAARRTAPLPVSRLEAIEESAVVQIRELEASTARRSPEDWLKLAEIYLAFGRIPEADYCFAQVDRFRLANPDYLYFWGTCLSRYGATTEARIRYERAIAAGSRLAPFCWFRIGLDRLRDENPRAAEAALSRAVGVPEARLFLARLLIREEEYDEARRHLLNLLADYPRALRPTQMLGWLEELAGNPALARDYLEQTDHLMERISRGDPSAAVDEMRVGEFGSRRLQLLSAQLDQRGQLSQAIQVSRQALAIRWRKNYALQLAHLLMREGSGPQAVAVLQECLQRFGASAEILEQLGDAYRVSGDIAQARATWEAGTRIPEGRPAPITYRLHSKLLDAYRQAGDTQAALRHEALAHYQAGRMAWEQDQLVTARQHFERTVELLPEHGPAWFYLAETRRFLDDRLGARHAYEQCLQRLPDHGRAQRGLARLND